jgi:hypothetical protein
MKTVAPNLYFVVHDEDGHPRRFSSAERAVSHAAILCYSSSVDGQVCSVFVHHKDALNQDPVGVMEIAMKYKPLG